MKKITLATLFLAMALFSNMDALNMRNSNRNNNNLNSNQITQNSDHASSHTYPTERGSSSIISPDDRPYQSAGYPDDRTQEGVDQSQSGSPNQLYQEQYNQEQDRPNLEEQDNQALSDRNTPNPYFHNQQLNNNDRRDYYRNYYYQQ